MKKNIIQLIDKKLNKKKWTKLNFSDLCNNIVEKITPKKSNLKHYIGLKHLDTGSLKINRFGKTENLDGDKLKIYKGDIIFAKRNAYLKRAAVADFDAVASAHSLVLRSKPKYIYPKFLPFFLTSEMFWNKAIEISVGSLSPTINWKSLAKQNFFVPPIKEQIMIAQLMWSLENLINKEVQLLNCLENLFKSKIKYISDNKIHHGQYKKLKEVCVIKDNLRKPLNSHERRSCKGKIPYYGANGVVDFIDKFIFNEDLVLIAEDGGNFKEYFCKEIAYKVSGKSWVNNHAHVLSANENMISNSWLLYSLIHKNILKHIIGTTRLKLNKSELEKINIWVPSRDVMGKFILDLDKIYDSRKITLNKLNKSRQLKSTIMNQIFNVL